MQEATRRYYLGELQKSDNEAYLSRLLAPLEMRPGTDVLDVGCGTGYCSAFVAATLAPRFNAGFDLDPEAMALARNLVNQPGINWFCASAESIPLAGSCVDHVICRGVLPLCNSNRALGEIARVLRPQGTAMLLLHHWTYYLHWLSLNPARWKKTVSGLISTGIGVGYALTGKQAQLRLGRHLFGQTFHTVHRVDAVLRRQGMRVYHVARESEFLVYARRTG